MNLECAGIKYYFVNAVVVCRCGYAGHGLRVHIENNRANFICVACGYLEQQVYGDEDDSQTKEPGFIPLEVGQMVKQIKEQSIEVAA